jgi:hypothetical protein
MRPIMVILFISLLIVLPFANQSRAEVSFGLSVDNEGVNSFYLAIGEHYQATEKQIVVVREKNVPDEEMPVVFFLARKAGVTPEVIIKMRLGGKSWMDITAHYGYTAEAFYVPVTVDPGPPYGKAYGHFKKRNRDQWKTISLTDDEIVNFVNLKFMSDYYQCPADDVIKLRGNGKNFVDINVDFKKKKQQKKDSSAKQASHKPDKGKGKGKK